MCRGASDLVLYINKPKPTSPELAEKKESISPNMLIFSGVLSPALSLPLNLNPSPRQSFRTQLQNLLSGGEGNSLTNPKSSTPSF